MANDDRENSKNRSYSNDDITVHWKPTKCIHVTTCYRELIDVFNPRKRPWVNMQGASTDEIIRVVDLCPTDALTYEWNSEKEQETRQEVPKTATKEESNAGAEIRVMKDGPLVIQGNFSITGSDGQVMRRMKMMSICRCGQSMKMPFCDGTHRKVGFIGE